MAVSKQVANDNLLNAWARVMNEKPFIFNQAAGTGAPLNANCHVYIQQEREDIARALDAAIKKMARVLRFWPRPKWFTDTINLGSNSVWGQIWKPPSSGKIIELGQRATTLLAAAASVTYSKSPANMPADNLATISVVTSVTDPAEIQLFFQTADGAPGAGDARYQIEPINVSISAGTATITADRALFVKPSTIWDVPFKPTDLNQTERNAADTSQATDFVTAVDVYRVYNDTTTPISIVDRNDTVLGSFDGKIWDARVGLIELADSCCQFVQGCHHPAMKVQIHYRAGEELVYGQMDSELEDACIRLANVLMPEEICSFCQRTQDRFRQDRSPMVEAGTATLPANNINNEFGSVVNGAVWAYNVATDRAIMRTSGKLTRNWRV